MNGKQTGLGSTPRCPWRASSRPLLVGPAADLWVSAKWILAVAHLAGEVLLAVAAGRRSSPGTS